MKYAVLGFVLALCGCPVQVDNVNVDQPSANTNVNIGAGGTSAMATMTIMADAGTGEAPTTPLKPAARRVETVEADAGMPEELPGDDSDAGTPDTQDACADADQDGVCDAVDKCPGHDDSQDSDHDGVPDGCDVCPAGSDADTDHNGYADACEQELASDWIHMTAPLSISDPYVVEQPALAILESWTPNDCVLDGVGLAFVGLPIHQLGANEQVTMIRPRAATGLAGKLADCLEAGVQLGSMGGLAASDDNYTGTNAYLTPITDRHMFPLLMGKHVTYFKVVATSYWTTQSVVSPRGTTVQDFQATISVHGY